MLRVYELDGRFEDFKIKHAMKPFAFIFNTVTAFTDSNANYYFKPGLHYTRALQY